MAPSVWSAAEAKANSSRGASGGVATLWNKTRFELTHSVSTTHWILTELLHKETGLKLSIFNIYVPMAPGEKHQCWNSIHEYLNTNPAENLILAGDLNITLSQAEKKGGNPIRDPAREWVEDLIAEWDLEDIKPLKGKYTWTNKRIGPGHIAARLDRFLVQQSLHLLGMDPCSSIIPFSASDHKPICLTFAQDKKLGPIPFRFNPAWISSEDCLPMIAATWKLPVRGSAFYVWEEKLRRVKNSLKEWAKLQKSPYQQRKEAEKAQENHYLRTEGDMDQDALNTEKSLQLALHSACRLEEDYWKLKSRNPLLQSGDRNTAFFHKQAAVRQHFNTVKEIHHNNNLLTEFEEIKQAAHDHFKDIYSESYEVPEAGNEEILDRIPRKVSPKNNRKLNA